MRQLNRGHDAAPRSTTRRPLNDEAMPSTRRRDASSSQVAPTSRGLTRSTATGPATERGTARSSSSSSAARRPRADRLLLWDVFQTLIHEVPAHAGARRLREVRGDARPARTSFNTLVEGVELGADRGRLDERRAARGRPRPARDRSRARSTPRCRRSDVPARGSLRRYASYTEALRLVDLVGIENLYAAYFLGADRPDRRRAARPRPARRPVAHDRRDLAPPRVRRPPTSAAGPDCRRGLTLDDAGRELPVARDVGGRARLGSARGVGGAGSRLDSAVYPGGLRVYDDGERVLVVEGRDPFEPSRPAARRPGARASRSSCSTRSLGSLRLGRRASTSIPGAGSPSGSTPATRSGRVLGFVPTTADDYRERLRPEQGGRSPFPLRRRSRCERHARRRPARKTPAPAARAAQLATRDAAEREAEQAAVAVTRGTLPTGWSFASVPVSPPVAPERP